MKTVKNIYDAKLGRNYKDETKRTTRTGLQEVNEKCCKEKKVPNRHEKKNMQL